MDAMKSSTRHASTPRGARSARSVDDRQEHLLEAFVAYCQACLVKDEAAATRESLIRLGFRAEQLADTGLGRFTSSADVHDHLASMGFSPAEIEAFSSATAELSGGWLVGPVRDAAGRLATFFAIEPAGDGLGNRCIYLRTSTPVPAVGLEVALDRAAGGRQHLVLVEDVLDALLLHSHGQRHVAAIGDPSRAFTTRRWEALAHLGVESVTLMFNARGAPHAALLDSLDESFHAAAAPAVWAVDPAELGKWQTAGELISQGGTRAWEDVVRRRHHGYTWRARSILFRHVVDGEFNDTARRAIMEEAHEFERLVGKEARRHDLEAHFWPPILKITANRNAPPDEKPAAAPRKSARPAPKAPAGAPATVADAVEPHERQLRARHGRMLLGLGQSAIAGLDEATLGFRGLMVLAGPPRCGKSSLAWQWATDVAAQNPDACVLFLSLKWPCYELLTRTKTRLAGLDWRSVVQGADPSAKAGEHFTEQERRKLQAAEAAMADWGRRVRVVDRARLPRPSVPSLLTEYGDLKTQTGVARGLIVVDCLEAWPLRERSTKHAGGLSPGERRMRLIERMRRELDDETALLIVSESGPSLWPSSSVGPPADNSAHSALAYLPDALLILSPGAATTDAEAEQRLSLNVIGGRHGVRSARIELVHRLEQSEFVIAPAAPRAATAAPASAPAVQRDSGRARQRFTWGPYGPDSG